ncbi:MAG TPA: IPT/TIG domain-containing protein, partial [Candidatus Ozemobacteraceae bacterium]|nr:IPT/TIG domain-containing protein [Candidatus Ozemobacteraceae bacterium]
MSQRFKLFGLLVFVGLSAGLVSLLTGCGGVNPTSSYTPTSNLPAWALDQGGISGRVTIGSSTFGIAGALIEAAQAQAISDADGIFLMGPLPQGEYRVTIRAAGYGPQVRTGVRVRSGLITDAINFQMSTETASATRDFSVVSLVPDFGTDGDEINVLGTGFGSVPGKVTVAGKDAAVMDWNSKLDGIIRIRLPNEVETGVVKVIINGENSHEASPVTFTGRPIALEVRPSGARPGQQVTIYGRNFHEIPSFNRVTLNGVNCTILPESNTRQLVILVPSNAQTGILNVSIQSPQIQLDGISFATLTIPPELIYLTPQRSIPDVTLTLYGKNFGNDVNAVSIKLGDRKRLGPNDLLSFSNNKVTFKAPDSTVLPPGESVDVWLYVNDIPCLTPLRYTAYNPALETLQTGQYGIYRFADKSNGNTLRLSKLAENERLAFLVSLCGDGTTDLAGSFSYAITSRLGGNNAAVPTLPTASLAASKHNIRHSPSGKTIHDAGTSMRSWYKSSNLRSSLRQQIRPSLDADAPASTTFWLVNFFSSDPSDPANDELATATLPATGTRCLVYVDNATDTVLTASNAENIATWFDNIYATIATACSDGISVPPEGNVDAQSRIVLFITPQINRGVTSGLVTYGYFNPRDKNLGSVHSNGTEILYFWDQAFEDPANFRGIMAH